MPALDPVTVIAALSGVALAVYLWSWTRHYILVTRSRISAQVTDAVRALTKQVDAILAPVKGLTVDALDARIETRLQGFSSQLDRKLEGIQAAMPDLPALREDIGREVANHVSMSIKEVQAQQAKEAKRVFEEMDLEGVSDDVMNAAIASMGTQAAAMQAIADVKIPRGMRDSSPALYSVAQMAKALSAQMIAGYRSQILQHAQAGGGMNLGVLTVDGSQGSYSPGIPR